MARVKEHKKTIELSDKKITFEIEKKSYKVIRFYPTRMTLDVVAFENGEKQGMQTMGFAQLPKETKRLIKAN